jgi:hypothetical protein
MALRDLFDGDKRSKEELRQLLEKAEAAQAALLSQLTAAETEKAAADRLVVDARLAVERREAELRQREESLNDRDGRITTEEERIRQADADLDASSKVMAARAAELDRRSEDLQKARLALDERSNQLASQRSQLDVRSHQLGNREHAVQQREREATAREADLVARERLLKVAEATLLKERTQFAPRKEALDDREYDLRRWELRRSTIEKSLADARSKVTALERVHTELNRRVSELLADVETHRQRADAAEKRRNEEAATHRERLRQLRELRAQLNAPLVLRVNDTDLLHTLACLNAQHVIEALGNEPVTLGSGPWKETEFDDALEQAGFVPQLLDDCATDFDVFIVGQEGVDIDALAGALEARLDQGLPVRLYSQELWLLHLMTGVDLLSLDTEMLQGTFGSEHPVLCAFVNEVWEWPHWPAPTDGVGPPGDSISLESGASPLHAFGYHAGKRTTATERRDKLKDFLLCKNLTPYFDADHHDAAYKAAWGRPSSSKRLHRMVSHIRWLHHFQGASPSKGAAREDWSEDLEWIRRALYKQTI